MMLRACPLSHVTLCMLASEAQDVALQLARYGQFNPVPPESRLTEGGNPAAAYKELHQEAAIRLAKIREQCGFEIAISLDADAAAPGLDELGELNAWLGEVWQACSRCHDVASRNAEERKRLEMLADTLGRLSPLGLDMSRLMRRDGLLDLRLGQVPAGNVKRLQESLRLAGFLFTQFDTQADQVFAVVVGPKGSEDGQSGLLSQAGWRELAVPEALQAHPDAVRRYLADASDHLDQEDKLHCAQRAHDTALYQERLQQTASALALAKPLADAMKIGVGGHGQLAIFSGWVPRESVGLLSSSLKERFHGRYLLDIREPSAEELEQMPSLLRYPFWLKPFLPLVHGYGVPRYGEFDPTLLFAISYLLLFGAMFGDLGHGLAIAMIAFVGAKSVPWLRAVGVAAGLSSMAFGVLYGSLFGYEDWIDPLWQSPLHDPMQMLRLAIFAGIGFIATTLLINTFNRIVSGRTRAALLDSAGLAGLLFYGGSAWSLYAVSRGHAMPGMGLLLTMFGIVLVIGYKWMETRADLGERLLITAIEALETATNLFANTLSFLRVAAFSLNHVALALAIFTLANGLDTFGHGLTVVFGNAVIVVLEGGIVAIQALRLMYYEGFSRFFQADGHLFNPLRLA